MRRKVYSTKRSRRQYRNQPVEIADRNLNKRGAILGQIAQEVSREDLEPAASPTPNMAVHAITEEDVRMFREDGYCICPHFFST
jgi:hypothetical protein